MSRKLWIAIAAAALVAIVSIGAFLYMTRGIAAPSESITASVQQIDASSASSGTVFRISQDDSTVGYSLYEQLNGSDKTVVGSTNQVAGDILVNLSDPAQSEIGDIAVNARTFATDDARRDNSVARFILQSEADANEFITFKPTSIAGLPDSISAGDTLTFKVTGDLTIAGTTNPVTFDVKAALPSADKLTGSATAVVQRSAFNLSIPSVPFVANVGNDVTLTINFVANAVTTTAA